MGQCILGHPELARPGGCQDLYVVVSSVELLFSWEETGVGSGALYLHPQKT